MAKFSHDTLKTHCTGISIGMFAADLGNLRQAAHDVASWGCKFAHFDIMDGVFVPQMTGGPGFLKTVETDMFRDVHMMVENPTSHVTSYVKAGADIITIQAESQNPADAISTLRAVAERENRTVLAGISLVPATAYDDSKISGCLTGKFRHVRRMDGGALIDQALALPPGCGLKLLTRTYALTVGLWQSFGSDRSADGPDELMASHADFVGNLEEALQEYWRGGHWHRSASNCSKTTAGQNSVLRC